MTVGWLSGLLLKARVDPRLPAITRSLFSARKRGKGFQLVGGGLRFAGCRMRDAGCERQVSGSGSWQPVSGCCPWAAISLSVSFSLCHSPSTADFRVEKNTCKETLDCRLILKKFKVT